VATTCKVTEKYEFRANVYGILALAFSPPKIECGKLYEAILQAHRLLCSNDESTPREHNSQDLATAQLSKEYLRLFVGPGRVQCPPYESVHRQDRPILERGLVMGPSTADVRHRYAEAGLVLPKNFTDLPDHIAVEMEFMHFLCSEELKSIEQGNLQESARRKTMEQEFLKEHLEHWVEGFADCVLKSTNSSFYKSAAGLLKSFVKNESEGLLGSSSE
jgi:putative dimethyl sulfoxide reductase chaperone